MTMVIEKDKLLEIVQKVMPAVEKKGVVEEMSHLVFDGNFILTYNDKVAISYPLPEDFELNCGVVASDFLVAVKGIKTREVTLNATPNGLVVFGGKNNTVLPFFDQKKIVELHDSLDIDSIIDNFIDLPQGFIDGLKVCKFAASDNLDNPRGVYAVRIKGPMIFASDGYQATRYPVEDIGLETTYIQKTFIDGIVNFNPVAAIFKKSWAFFVNEDNAIYSCRTSNVDHVYPTNVDGIFFDFEEGFKFVENLDEELTSLEFFSEGTDKADKAITIKITEDGKCLLSTMSSKGSVSIETEVEGFKQEEIEFIINPAALRGTINHEGIMKVDKKMLMMKTKTFDHLTALRVKT